MRTSTDSARPTQSTEHPLTRRFADRFGGQPAWVAVTEIFIGLGWARAATSKLIDPSWWNGDYLRQFVAEHSGEALPWYSPFLDGIVGPNAVWVSLMVLVLQVGVAASLLTGKARAAGLGFAMAMNLHFLAAGAVNPSAFYLLAQGALILWLIDQWSPEDRRSLLPTVAASGLAVAGFNVAFIGTLHPADVIDDPAIMFITVGTLACLASLVTLANDQATDLLMAES